jgi:hypothetical protein
MRRKQDKEENRMSGQQKKKRMCEHGEDCEKIRLVSDEMAELRRRIAQSIVLCEKMETSIVSRGGKIPEEIDEARSMLNNDVYAYNSSLAVSLRYKQCCDLVSYLEGRRDCLRMIADNFDRCLSDLQTDWINKWN